MLTQNSKNHQYLISDPQRQKDTPLNQKHLHLQRTPSSFIPNRYIQQLADRSTSKKRKQTPLYAPPILIDQNQQLLSQNRQLTSIINQKNKTIEAFQFRLDQLRTSQGNILRQVDLQKKRLIQEILTHKEETDRQVTQLGGEVTRLKIEKQELERQYQLQLRKRGVSFEQERVNENSLLKIQFQQNITLLKQQNCKLKQEIQRRSNQLQLYELQSRQKITELSSRCSSLSDELKHFQQIRKIQLSQLLMNQESKLQKLHLDHRREKEIFLMEHESEVKRRDEVIKTLRRRIEELEDGGLILMETVERERMEKDGFEEKLRYQAEGSIAQLKEMGRLERGKLEELLKAELNLVQQSSSEEMGMLMAENKRLSGMLELKQVEISRLLRVIDEARDSRLAEMEESEKIMRELQSKVFTNLLAGEAETEALKVKLAHLREADITGLRNYHEHQIQSLSRALAEKEGVAAGVREKYHEQLRKKVEMRRHFELEGIKYKARILQLQNQIDILKVKFTENEHIPQPRASTETTSISFQRISQASPSKNYQLKTQQILQLQSMLVNKDRQIQELNLRLQLLKDHHHLQRSGWQTELQTQREQVELLGVERTRNKEIYQIQMLKMKELLRKEKEGFQIEVGQLRKQHRTDFDEVMLQLSEQRLKQEEERRVVEGERRKSELEGERLRGVLLQKEGEMRLLKGGKRVQISDDFSKDKERETVQDFYLEKLRVKDGQMKDLEERIGELASDLRDARENYSDLQQRMQQLIESQSTLRQIQRKVMNLGKENNIVKNLKEINKP